MERSQAKDPGSEPDRASSTTTGAAAPAPSTDAGAPRDASQPESTPERAQALSATSSTPAGAGDLVAHEVFLSYASQDARVAEALARALEGSGIRCWIAMRDAAAGAQYGASIIGALTTSRAVVVVLSSHALRSQWVTAELERAASKRKPILPLRIEAVEPTGAIELYIAGQHWFDLIDQPLEPRVPALCRTLLAMLRASASPGETEVRPFPAVQDGEFVWSHGAAQPYAAAHGDPRRAPVTTTASSVMKPTWQRTVWRQVRFLVVAFLLARFLLQLSGGQLWLKPSLREAVNALGLAIGFAHFNFWRGRLTAAVRSSPGDRPRVRRRAQLAGIACLLGVTGTVAAFAWVAAVCVVPWTPSEGYVAKSELRKHGGEGLPWFVELHSVGDTFEGSVLLPMRWTDASRAALERLRKDQRMDPIAYLLRDAADTLFDEYLTPNELHNLALTRTVFLALFVLSMLLGSAAFALTLSAREDLGIYLARSSA